MISSREAANRLGVSQATVLRAVLRGTLKPARTTGGGHRRFRPEDIDALAQTLRHDLASNAHLISTGQAARLLGLSQPTVVRAIREGRLRPDETTPGGHHRFVEERIRELAPSTAELVGTGGAARALGLTVNRVLRAVLQGRLSPAAITPGGHRRFAARTLAANGDRQDGRDGLGHGVG